jgi:hypothetical protein
MIDFTKAIEIISGKVNGIATLTALNIILLYKLAISLSNTKFTIFVSVSMILLNIIYLIFQVVINKKEEQEK